VCHAHARPPGAASPGSEVELRTPSAARCGLTKDRLVEFGIRQEPLQASVLLLQILQPLRLVRPQPAILPLPPVVDTIVFLPLVMKQIVERVDAHLGQRGSLDEISRGFGLSPSHFARKFQQSTGLSLNRFMNRRRIGQSLTLLKTGRVPLAQLSLDLGFSSQSHITRLFSGLTGITPYQFRRAQRRMGE